MNKQGFMARMMFALIGAFLALVAATIWEGFIDFRKEEAMLTLIAQGGTASESAPTRQQIVQQAIREYNSAVSSTVEADCAHFLRDLGISFLVAFALILLLEYARSKREEEESKQREQRATAEFEQRLQTLSTRVLSAVYQHDLPNDLFKVIQEKIFGADLVRRDVEVEAEIHSLDMAGNNTLGSLRHTVQQVKEKAESMGIDPKDWVVLKIEMTFEINNSSLENTVQFELPFRMERYFPGTEVNSAGIESIQVNGQEYLERPLFTTSPEAPTMVAYRGNPIQLPPKSKREILMRGFAVRHIDDQELWISRFISEDTEIKLRDYTGKELYMEMCSLSFYPEKAEQRHISNLDNHRSEVVMKLERIVLPFQGVHMKWSPRAKAISENPPSRPPSSDTGTEKP